MRISSSVVVRRATRKSPHWLHSLPVLLFSSFETSREMKRPGCSVQKGGGATAPNSSGASGLALFEARKQNVSFAKMKRALAKYAEIDLSSALCGSRNAGETFTKLGNALLACHSELDYRVVARQSSYTSAPREDVNYADELNQIMKASRDMRASQTVHVFVDISNICGAPDCRINPRKLLDKVVGGRKAAQIYAVGSEHHGVNTGPTSQKWNRWRDRVGPVGEGGCDPHLVLLTKTLDGREEAVDDLLHAAILKEAGKNYGEQRRTIVVLTGDGNNNGGRATTFPEAIEKALQMGWLVELWCYKNAANAVYKRLAEDSEICSVFQLFDLNRFLHEISDSAAAPVQSGGVALPIPYQRRTICKYWTGKPGSCIHSVCQFLHNEPATLASAVAAAVARKGLAPVQILQRPKPPLPETLHRPLHQHHYQHQQHQHYQPPPPPPPQGLAIHKAATASPPIPVVRVLELEYGAESRDEYMVVPGGDIEAEDVFQVTLLGKEFTLICPDGASSGSRICVQVPKLLTRERKHEEKLLAHDGEKYLRSGGVGAGGSIEPPKAEDSRNNNDKDNSSSSSQGFVPEEDDEDREAVLRHLEAIQILFSFSCPHCTTLYFPPEDPGLFARCEMCRSRFCQLCLAPSLPGCDLTMHWQDCEFRELALSSDLSDLEKVSTCHYLVKDRHLFNYIRVNLSSEGDARTLAKVEAAARSLL